MIEESKGIKSWSQIKLLFDNIRLFGDIEVSSVRKIYTASEDGWMARDFHRHCDDQGATVSVIRTSDDCLAAAFTSISWTSRYQVVNDPNAMVFALTNELELQAFKANNPVKAVYHDSDRGPVF